MKESYFQAFFFAEQDKAADSRFGGPPPFGVDGPTDSQYLLTAPLPDGSGRQATVFLCCDFDYILDHSGELLSDSSVAIRVHRPTVGRSDAPSSFPEFTLALSEETQEGTEPYESHKIGGQPYLIDLDQASLKDVFSRGFVQILQLDIPVNKEDIEVDIDWPFGDGIFHLLGRPPFTQGEWIWFWEMQ